MGQYVLIYCVKREHRNDYAGSEQKVIQKCPASKNSYEKPQEEQEQGKHIIIPQILPSYLIFLQLPNIFSFISYILFLCFCFCFFFFSVTFSSSFLHFHRNFEQIYMSFQKSFLYAISILHISCFTFDIFCVFFSNGSCQKENMSV